MILLADVGNSSLKWALYEGGNLQTGTALRHGRNDLADLLPPLWEGLTAPARVVISNVAGAEAAEDLQAVVNRLWGIEAELIVPAPKSHGVVNAYVEPQRLGADRWAALVAARQRVKGPAIVVDCGTAITLDALAANGDHLGGLIVPGLAMMRNALVEKTAEVRDDCDGHVSLLARDTHGAVTGGALYAAVALIDRVTADMSAELGQPVIGLIAGGDAEKVLPLLAGTYHHEADLVLQGLAVLAGDE